MNRHATPGQAADPAGSAIATVLRAEAAARHAIAQAEQQADEIVEAARAADRALVERTERRIRAVVSAFERELAARLAEIDAEAERMATPLSLRDDEIAALERAVAALASELAAGAP